MPIFVCPFYLVVLCCYFLKPYVCFRHSYEYRTVSASIYEIFKYKKLLNRLCEETEKWSTAVTETLVIAAVDRSDGVIWLIYSSVSR